MDNQRISSFKSQFDASMHTMDDTDIEYWSARDLMILLGYKRWENFEKAIQRAMTSCDASGMLSSDHFREVTKIVELGSGAHRRIKDFMLSRYACCLTVQNGDPQKEEIAFAQAYFALKARTLELLQERIACIDRAEAPDRFQISEMMLTQNIYERGVDDAGPGRIRSKGDAALFGSHAADEMKQKPCLPALTVAAKNLAAEMTKFNIDKKDLHGESAITMEHVQNNASVRSMLGERGIKPEELPPTVERRIKSQEIRCIAP